MWRRAIIRVAVCLALGAATSVGVAWMFAAMPSFRSPRAAQSGTPPLRWVKSGSDTYVVRAVRYHPGVSGYVVRRVTEDIASLIEQSLPGSRPRYASLPSTGNGEDSVATTACGWPLRVLKWETRFAGMDSVPVQRGYVSIAIPSRERAIRLPFLPICSGLAANTVLYASLWAAILFAPATLRRHIRRRRGRCVRCGYDLCGDLAAGCPECGWNRVQA